MQYRIRNNQLGAYALKTLVTLLFITYVGLVLAQPKPKPVPPPVQLGKDGKLEYIADSMGNRIPDYSYCGYQTSGNQIPLVDVKVVITSINGDATQLLQKAIDYVASLPVNTNGFRGAVLLKPGTYSVSGRLNIKHGGIVLRGSGSNEAGTNVVASGIDRETLIRIEGDDDRSITAENPIVDSYVPVNATRVRVSNGQAFNAGDRIFIRRPSTQAWIDLLDMNQFGGETAWLGWKPGERDIVWDRTIKQVNGDTITLDVPLTMAIEKSYGDGLVSAYQWKGRIENIGIENINFVSAYDTENPKDEQHCWNAISFENVRNGWVRQCRFKHFAGSAVALFETASCVTVEDCMSLEPVSEIAEFRRNTFFNAGQQNLFQSVYAEFGYHDFAMGFCAPGPNAFVQCESHLPFQFSGTVDSWASGVLFDIVHIDGHALSLKNREQDGYGAGWTAANCMLWQCSASRIECYRPSGAQNWAFGAWAQFAGNGYWHQPNSHVNPRSFYYSQLADRITLNDSTYRPILPVGTEASSSPTIEQAAEIVEMLSKEPIIPLRKWVEQAPERNPIATSSGNAPSIDQIKSTTLAIQPVTEQILQLKNGWLVRGEKVMTGNRIGSPWWSGNLRPRGIQRAAPALTRYVPGRIGTGFTDDLQEVANTMLESNRTVYEQNYALWYDRRRDDHERIRRMDGEAWAPFYELPFARSGKELAWDGLSKYDLTQYNSWYWNRLKQFADLADQNGLLLIHQNYFQHNIIEAGAHWVDSPWRTVNNINHTDFSEPPPFAGDKRIFIAHEFYDIDHPVRRELHRKYIRKCLDNFADNSGVLQQISAEYTGPLHFVQFWLDVIAEWETETGRNVLVGLSTTKDVQDAILSDPKRSQWVDVIDIRYWASNSDGVYAPKGGLNLAPRQHARIEKTGKQTIETVYADVLEYRQKYSNKAVIYSFNMADNMAWGIFMAGGSLAHIPKVEAHGFFESASSMKPVANAPQGQWMLENPQGEKIIYVKGSEAIEVSMGNTGKRYKVVQIDATTGKVTSDKQQIKGNQKATIRLTSKNAVVVWIVKS